MTDRERHNPQAINLPVIIEQTHRGERQWDLFSRLLKDRIIFLGDAIYDVNANVIIGQLLFLESDDPEKDIHIYVNSPGGSVNAGLAVYDTMQYVRCPISTICVGQASNMAAILMAAGTPGKRYALPHSRFLMHQPLGGFSGQATDVDIAAKELLFIKKQLNEIVAMHTGQPEERVAEDTDRDFYLGPLAAKEYGIIDEVLDRK